MSTHGNSARRIRPEDLHVAGNDRPDWVAGTLRMPGIGEEVLCAGGPGVVSAVLGKTGDGSRLLEIRLADPAARPFFAAASNVLVAPE